MLVDKFFFFCREIAPGAPNKLWSLDAKPPFNGSLSRGCEDVWRRYFLFYRPLWRAVYAPGDGQTSPAYSSHSVQCLYINHLLSVNKLVLSYLLLRLLPHPTL
jgi:hypothetical protein